MNYVVFDETKCLRTLTKYNTKVYNKTTIHVNELILTPFSPFDITVNAKYLKRKTSEMYGYGIYEGEFFMFSQGCTR